MRNRLTVALLAPAAIVIPQAPDKKGKMVDVLKRTPLEVDDAMLERSVKDSGIQQPLVVLSDGEKFILIDGKRRLDAAKKLGIPKVPVAIDMLPEGEPDAIAYVKRMRFILDEHRQDLMPTQKGELIARLKTDRRFTNGDLAHFLGCDEDSIYNWLAVLKYIPEVQQAMDAGHLTMRAARIFDGMTEEGQQHVWKGHRGELLNQKGRAEIHRKLRATYPPEKHPTFYRSAKLLTSRLNQGHKKRTSAVALEKKKLLGSMEKKEQELAELKVDAADAKRENEAATPIVAAFLRDPKLRALIPEAMLPDLEQFASVYAPKKES